MIDEFIQDTYGSRRGFLRYQLDALICRLGFFRPLLPPRSKVAKVIFVCHGNICRSALAEAVFKEHSSIPTASIGLHTTTGNCANERLMNCARVNLDMDLSSHRTTSLDDYQVHIGDVFVCMEINHILQLKKRGYKNPSVLLGAFGREKLARVNDPFSANDRYMKKTVISIVYHTTELAKSLEK